MELDDCAFPLLAGIDITDDAKAAFDGVNVALLVGARPRTAGMERGDLLEANGGIFKPQGEAINAGAADDVRVLVVGNPANTNALIAAVARARRAEDRVHRHDPARPQPGDEPARRTRPAAPVSDIHAAHDLGQPLGDAVPRHLRTPWSPASRPRRSSTTTPGSRHDFIPTVAKRGAAIIEARGASSAASAANAAIDHVFSWVNGTADGRLDLGRHRVRRLLRRARGPDLVVPRDLRPAATGRSCQGLDVDDFSRARIDASVAELVEERDAVQGLGLV